MAITTIKDLRRQQLLEAAFEIIKQQGLAATSVSRIADEANTSKGIVHHYFRSKQQLMHDTLRHAHAKRREDLVNRLRKAQTPSDRLTAVLSLLLDEKYLQAGFCRVWVAVYSELHSDRLVARLYKAIQVRECSNLAHAFKPFLPKNEARKAALNIRSLIEGIRFRLGAVPPVNYDARVHITQVRSFLRHKIPAYDSSAAVPWPAPR
jgi:TetR/AcrR family transcriptional repressor of bet genes